MLHLCCSYIFLVNFELLSTWHVFFVVVKSGQVLIWWVLIIRFQFLIVLHDINQNLIISFIKPELKLFLIDSFQKTIRIRVYCPTCLCWGYALHNIVPESIVLTVNTIEKLACHGLILEFLISFVLKSKSNTYS